MTDWKVSSYTMFVEGEQSDEHFLYNSFMGALTKLSDEYSSKIRQMLRLKPGKYREPDDSTVSGVTVEADAVLRELARGGFLVPAEISERERVNTILERERDFPFHLIALPHEDCNFRCTYCYEKFERGKMSPEVVSALKVLIAEKARRHRAINVGWFGGEPCLALDVIYDLSLAFQAACAMTGSSYRSSMTTNGYFLTQETVQRLLKCGVNHFQITLDGVQADHDLVRHLAGGQPTYVRIVNNLRGMRQVEGDFSVAIRVNFSSKSFIQMPKFIDELAEDFASDPRFFLDFHAMGRWGGHNDSQLDVVEQPGVHQAKLQLLSEAGCHGFRPTGVIDGLQPHGSVCYAGKPTSIVVGSDGRLYKCTVAFSDPRNHVGWLRPDGTLEIDQRNWDRWVNPVSPSGKCNTCTFAGSCQSRACPLAAMDEGEPPCPHSESELVDLIRISAAAVPR